MPNHVENDLFIEGPSKKLKEFIEFAKGINPYGQEEAIVTEKFIPYPKKFADMDREAKQFNEELQRKADAGKKVDWSTQQKDGFNSGGYEWCLTNWGTKWGIYESEYLEDEEDSWISTDKNGNATDREGSIKYTFQSAWSPPKLVVLKMSEMFPELIFDLRYFECGAMFNGMYKCKAGEILKDESAAYYGSRGG